MKEGKRGRQFRSQGSMTQQSMNNHHLVELVRTSRAKLRLEVSTWKHLGAIERSLSKGISLSMCLLEDNVAF